MRLFEDIRWTKKISIFPVGITGYGDVNSPIVRMKTSQDIPVKAESSVSYNSLNSASCQVIGFSDLLLNVQKFPVDMAGFAANVDFIASRTNQSMPYIVGYGENYFLQSLNVSLSDLEPMSECCTKVYVWHTKTVSRRRLPTLEYSELKDTNLNTLLRNLEENGIVRMDSRRGQQIFTCTKPDGCNTTQGRPVV